jgi:histone deacetylase complex regulatory component SIN3
LAQVAEDFLRRVDRAYSGRAHRHRFVEFTDIMRTYREGLIESGDVILSVERLFEGKPSLLKSFFRFMKVDGRMRDALHGKSKPVKKPSQYADYARKYATPARGAPRQRS